MNIFKNKSKDYDLEVFAIYDAKVGAYSECKFAINEHDFVRGVLNTFKDPTQSQNKYLVNAEDYTLFQIGTYSLKDGKIEGITPKSVIGFHELRTMADNERARQSTEVSKLGH